MGNAVPYHRVPLNDAHIGDLIERSVDNGETWECAFVIAQPAVSEVRDFEGPDGDGLVRYRLVRELSSTYGP